MPLSCVTVVEIKYIQSFFVSPFGWAEYLSGQQITTKWQSTTVATDRMQILIVKNRTSNF